MVQVRQSKAFALIFRGMTLALVFVAVAHVAEAQLVRGFVSGTVTDATDAIIAGVQVTITNKATNISRDTVRLKNMRTGRSVAVVIHYDSTTHGVTIDPSFRLSAGTLYRIKVSDQIRDLAGNPLARRYFLFTTRT